MPQQNAFHHFKIRIPNNFLNIGKARMSPGSPPFQQKIQNQIGAKKKMISKNFKIEINDALEVGGVPEEVLRWVDAKKEVMYDQHKKVFKGNAKMKQLWKHLPLNLVVEILLKGDLLNLHVWCEISKTVQDRMKKEIQGIYELKFERLQQVDFQAAPGSDPNGVENLMKSIQCKQISSYFHSKLSWTWVDDYNPEMAEEHKGEIYLGSSYCLDFIFPSRTTGVITGVFHFYDTIEDEENVVTSDTLINIF
jgi:hypothetical protein